MKKCIGEAISSYPPGFTPHRRFATSLVSSQQQQPWQDSQRGSQYRPADGRGSSIATHRYPESYGMLGFESSHSSFTRFRKQRLMHHLPIHCFRGTYHGQCPEHLSGSIGSAPFSYFAMRGIILKNILRLEKAQLEKETLPTRATSSDEETFKRIGKAISSYPPGFTSHRNLARILDSRS